MGKYIQYKRIKKRFFSSDDIDNNIDNIFKEIIADGYDIITYSEKKFDPNGGFIEIIILCGKLNEGDRIL